MFYEHLLNCRCVCQHKDAMSNTTSFAMIFQFIFHSLEIEISQPDRDQIWPVRTRRPKGREISQPDGAKASQKQTCHLINCDWLLPHMVQSPRRPSLRWETSYCPIPSCYLSCTSVWRVPQWKTWATPRVQRLLLPAIGLWPNQWLRTCAVPGEQPVWWETHCRNRCSQPHRGCCV